MFIYLKYCINFKFFKLQEITENVSGHIHTQTCANIHAYKSVLIYTITIIVDGVDVMAVADCLPVKPIVPVEGIHTQIYTYI